MPTHKLRCAAPRYDPGGGGINVARAVHALGGEAVAIFPVGGAAGEMIQHLLDEEDVAYDAVAIAGFTRESLAVEERADRATIPLHPARTRDFRARSRNAASTSCRVLAAEASYIVASGSLPLGVPDDFYARVAALAKSLGKRLVLDTSGAALKQAGGGIYLLKPSLRELQDLVGREIRTERDQECAAQQIIEQGRSDIVVLSLGEEGALLATARGVRALRRDPGRRREARSGRATACWRASFSACHAACALNEAVRFGMAAGAAALFGIWHRAVSARRCRAALRADVVRPNQCAVLLSRTLRNGALEAAEQVT